MPPKTDTPESFQSLARQHYENFPVASVLLPAHLRQPVGLIYAFARQADDFADEGDFPAEMRLALLDGYRQQLGNIAKHDVSDPFFSELAVVIEQHHLPLEPFYHLLDAFSQDVIKTRYANFDELLDYCRRSANPVGHLMLYLFDAATPSNLALSDAICTSLQIINFLQDIAIDFEKNRVYLPQDELARLNITEGQIARHETSPSWETMMLFQIQRAQELMNFGKPLTRKLKGRIGLELRMIVAGGESILSKLRKNSASRHRPVLTAWDWPMMFFRSVI